MCQTGCLGHKLDTVPVLKEIILQWEKKTQLGIKHGSYFYKFESKILWKQMEGEPNLPLEWKMYLDKSDI